MLVLKTLGGAVLLDERHRPLISEQRRRLAVLAILATGGDAGIPRDRLIALLWPESTTEHARHALHQLLYYLRRDCDPAILDGTDPLRLNARVIRSDLAAFARSLATGSFHEAAEVYGGPFLDGFFLTGTDEFERWVERQRARLHAQYLDALHRLAQEADTGPSPTLAVNRWRAFATAEPLSAVATVGLMRALARAGDPSSALRQARIHERAVREELGGAPAPEVTALVAELNSAAADAARRQTQFRGREFESSPAAPAHATTRAAHSRRPLAGAALVVLLLAGAGYTVARQRSAAAAAGAAPSAPPAIAFLPFAVNDPELRPWVDGALVVLAANTDGIAGVRAIDPQTIHAALRDAATASPATPALTPNVAGEVARRTGARHVVAGSIVALGPVVRVTAEVREAESGAPVRQLQVEGRADSMFALLDALALDVLRTVLRRERMSVPARRMELARRSTTSLPALKAYLEGERFYQESRFADAALSYQLALEADSTFALMFSRFLVPYSFASQATPPSVPDPLGRALRLIDRLPEREALLVRASAALASEDLATGIALLRRASTLYPDDYEVWYSLGEVLLHRGGDQLLPPEEALRAFAHAVRLNPAFGPPYTHLVETTLAYRGDAVEAAAIDSAYRAVAPGAENATFGSIALALASESTRIRSAAIAVLDTLPLFAVQEVSVFLRHQRFRDAQERALAILIARAREQTPGDHPYAARALLARGQLAAAADMAMEYDPCPVPLVYWTHLLGGALSEKLAGGLVPENAASYACPNTAYFIAGAFAVERNRPADLVAARVALAASARARLADGDTTNARQFALLDQALGAYRQARSDHATEGIDALRTLQPQLRADYSEIVRWWLGQLLLESSPAAARRYFASFWHTHWDVAASYYLGRIDERVGAAREARTEYLRFAHAWRDGDAVLQHRLADARARAGALRARARRN